MLREIEGVRQDNPAATRRWFQSDYFDLFTWQDGSGGFTRFQLCYDVERDERAFEWSAQHGFFHDGVEYADRPGSRPAAAILTQEGKLDSGTVVPRFTREAAHIAADVREFILGKIREHLIERHQVRSLRKEVRRAAWQKRNLPGAAPA